MQNIRKQNDLCGGQIVNPEHVAINDLHPILKRLLPRKLLRDPRHLWQLHNHRAQVRVHLQQRVAVQACSAANVEQRRHPIHRHNLGKVWRNILSATGQRQRKVPRKFLALHCRAFAFTINERHTIVVIRAKRTIALKQFHHVDDAR